MVIERYTKSSTMKMIKAPIMVIFRMDLSPAELHIRNERRRAGDIGLDTGRRRCPRDDIADRRHRFLPQGRALVAGQIQLHICGLAVGALRARRRESISPQILHVLDVLRYRFSAREPICRSRRVHRLPAAAAPSSTSIAKLSESDSLKSLPMRFMACTAGASWGPAVPNAVVPTLSSDGTPNVTIRVSATQARMMSTESLRIIRAMTGGRVRWVLMRPPSAGGAIALCHDVPHGCRSHPEVEAATYCDCFRSNERTNGRGPDGPKQRAGGAGTHAAAATRTNVPAARRWTAS